ncbi:MAG: hypothetical protein ACFFDO_09965 [Candidatus Thorarchaeota archaeon]
MAEMMQDLLNSIYNRIAQLGQAIQSLKTTLDELNQNIEQKISNLNERILEFSKEINVTQTIHIDALKEIGLGVTNEIEKIRQGLALDSFQNMISSLENFEKLASEVLNQDTVNLLLSEAIESVKKLKENLREEEVSG